jgi:hypothetical protein
MLVCEKWKRTFAETMDLHATIILSSRISAQGPIVARHEDGGVSIDAGGRRLRGTPVPSLRASRGDPSES